MSIDINWETLTGGADGETLAQAIREFIHDRFQKVTLPRFIRSVEVHSFDFGSVVPELEVKDVCDPLPDFYEVDDDDSDAESDGAEQEEHEQGSVGQGLGREQFGSDAAQSQAGSSRPPLAREKRPQRPTVDTKTTAEHAAPSPIESPSYFQPHSSTPAIPGGTSNLNRLHHPFSAGISGISTPLSAFAGAHFASGWPDPQSFARPYNADRFAEAPRAIEDPFRRGTDMPLSGPASDRDISPNDVQTVIRIRYSGDFKLSLTAEILLDYPMQSFVGIPLQLNVSGMDFDGVAILAYIKRKVHFCFLAPEDADALVGGDASPETPASPASADDGRAPARHVGGLFENIRVESEIGQRNNSKQVLKNVGKVEKFVLEQVRRIFESELVYPSFWTFLV